MHGQAEEEEGSIGSKRGKESAAAGGDGNLPELPAERMRKRHAEQARLPAVEKNQRGRTEGYHMKKRKLVPRFDGIKYRYWFDRDAWRAAMEREEASYESSVQAALDIINMDRQAIIADCLRLYR